MIRKTIQSVLIRGIADKPVEMAFRKPDQSSDGGAVLLKAVDERLGLTRRLAAALHDKRQEHKIEHPLVDLLRERVYAIACGYPDCNDVTDRLTFDPVMKMMCGHSPEAPGALASQPTLSRFENSLRRRDLLRMGYALSDTVIERERRRRKRTKVHRITVDMDPTEDPTYGGQQMTFFNAYYANWCYLPMVTTIQFADEAEQFLVAPVLRPGNAKGSAGARAILARLIPRLRRAFPKACLRVRMDGAFATPEVLEWLEKNELEYLVNVGKNSVLLEKAAVLMKKVRALARESGKTEKCYGAVRYQAGKWKRPRRVIVKAEVVQLEGREPRDNPRFVVTNCAYTPRAGYEQYAQRGDMENRCKELKDGLRFDLTSCTKFEANQFRNLLTAAAYVLYQGLRVFAAGTEFARAQVSTLREKLIKIGITAMESVRRILLEGPLAYPWANTWRRIARACAPLTG